LRLATEVGVFSLLPWEFSGHQLYNDPDALIANKLLELGRPHFIEEVVEVSKIQIGNDEIRIFNPEQSER